MNNKLNFTMLLLLVLMVFTSCQKEATIIEQEALEQEVTLNTSETNQLKLQLEETGLSAEDIEQILNDIANPTVNEVVGKLLCTNGNISSSTAMNFTGTSTDYADFLCLFKSTTIPDGIEFINGVMEWERSQALDCGTHEGWIWAIDNECNYCGQLAYEKVTYVDCF